jgi:nucleoside-diphosphate-sugar epimerase
VGTGEDITILEVAKMIVRVTGFNGEMWFDDSRKNGSPRMLLDVSRITKMGWRPRTSLENGLNDVYRWYTENVNTARKSA